MFGFGTIKQERKKEKPQDVCVQVMRKHPSCVCLYTNQNLELKAHKEVGNPYADRFGYPKGILEPSLVSMFCLVLLS